MPSWTLALLAALTAAGGLAVVVLVASFDDSARHDARSFLERYDELDVDDPVENRRILVDRLEQLPLRSEEIDRARDLCVMAHRTLIRAEDASARARATYRRATEGGVPESDIPNEVRAAIESSLAESNDALALTRERMPRCDETARSLRLRFVRH